MYADTIFSPRRIWKLFPLCKKKNFALTILWKLKNLSEWLSSKRSQITNVGEDVEKREPSYTIGGNVNWYSHCGKQYGDFSKTKTMATIWSSNSTPGYISKTKNKKTKKTLIQKDKYTPMFIAALFTIAKIWKRPKCPSIDEWIGTSLVVQWLRIRLPMQGTQVRTLAWEDPSCCEAAKPMCHNYWCLST